LKPQTLKKSTIIIGAILLCSLLALLTVNTGKELFFRYTLPYSETGKYFDEANSVVYREQAIFVYGLASALCLFAFVIGCRWTLRQLKSS